MPFSLCLTRSVGPGSETRSVQLGHPLLDDYQPDAEARAALA